MSINSNMRWEMRDWRQTHSVDQPGQAEVCATTTAPDGSIWLIVAAISADDAQTAGRIMRCLREPDAQKCGIWSVRCE